MHRHELCSFTHVLRVFTEDLLLLDNHWFLTGKCQKSTKNVKQSHFEIYKKIQNMPYVVFD